MGKFLRNVFLFLEDRCWNFRCWYNFWLYGPYGLSGVIEKMPSQWVQKYLRKYGATIGEECRIEKGINLHRPGTKDPFKNLIIGDHVYIGHKAKVDLSRKVTIHDHVIIGSRCMFWTHAGCYDYQNPELPEYLEKYGEIDIQDFTMIYSGVIISYGVSIGKKSKIAAGSVVNKSLEQGCFYGGIPAKFIQRMIQS